MFPPSIIAEAAVNGLLTGAVYALVALGLTLIYGVLHIVNFAHGALLTVAMFGVWLLATQFGIGPYWAAALLVPVFFAIGYGLQRLVIGPASGGRDSSVLLVTLGLAIIVRNALLAGFGGDTRTLGGDAGFDVVAVGPMLLSRPRLIGFAGAVVVAAVLWVLLTRTDVGRAIRAVAKEPLGARAGGDRCRPCLRGDVRLRHGLSGGWAAGLLMPTFYVNPTAGETFVLVAFTVVVLGAMGSIPGALLGGLVIGVVESLSGLFFGDSVGQAGIFVVFIAVLLLRPAGLFGARA